MVPCSAIVPAAIMRFCMKKCGFTIAGEDKGLSSTGGAEVEEVILILR